MGIFSTIGTAVGTFFGGNVGAAVGGALGGVIDSEDTADTAEGAANAANVGAQADIDLRRRMYDESVARQKPFYEAGVNALPGYLSGIEQGGELVRGFTSSDFTTDPGYAFRISEGQKALDRQAAARGGLISGGALRAATRYGQDMGSQEYQNAYTRFRDTQGLRRNALAGVVGYGPSSSNAMSAAGQNYATGAGPQMYQQGVNTGNALITGQVGRESAYGQIGNVFGKYLSNNTFKRDPFGGGSGTFDELWA